MNGSPSLIFLILPSKLLKSRKTSIKGRILHVIIYERQGGR